MIPDRIEPGQIRINSAIITATSGLKINVKNIILQITIYEDITSPFITGTMTLSDAGSLSEALPFTGEELLLLDIQNNDNNQPSLERREETYHIYKMEGRENISLKNVMYTLHFISYEALIDANRKISKTFNGKVTDIATDIIKTPVYLGSNKDFLNEPSTNRIIYTSNFWTPIQNIVYLTDTAVNKNNNPGYLFFENNLGFIFASTDLLMSGPPLKQFIRDSKTRLENDTQDVEEINSRILDMSTPVFYDYYDRVQQGYYGSRVYSYDIESKKLNLRNYISKFDTRKNQLNKNIAIGSKNSFAPDSTTFINVYNRNLYTGSPYLSPDHDSKRLSLLKQIQAFTTNIQVYGNLSYSVGNVIDLLIYKDTEIIEKDTDENIIDNVLSGRYLITALSHEITKESHYTNMELSKDSINKSI